MRRSRDCGTKRTKFGETKKRKISRLTYPHGITADHTFPTKAEAQAKVVTLVLSPARNLMGAVKGPGGRVLGIVKSIEETLEKGEAIAKIA